MSAPTLINLPPPQSDPATPSEIPLVNIGRVTSVRALLTGSRGTPNSTTTSMSELSTVAIKDGHRGHPHHHSHRQQASTQENQDVERADRISRLAGLERVSTIRQSSNTNLPVGTSANQTQDYFDAPPPPGGNSTKERSTVGSASATGSAGGRTTWASGSDAGEATDKMSEDQEMDASSVGGFSDEGNASLVGFGEGASSTVSGPISTAHGSRTPQGQSAQLSSRMGGAVPSSRDGQDIPMTGVTPTGPKRDVRMIDGMTYDQDVIDTSHVNPTPGGGVEAAERIMNDRFSSDEGGMSKGTTNEGKAELGKFSFEHGK